MRCLPETHQLYALRDQRLTWTAALAELIDNALDAGAKEIKFGWPARHVFEFADDGGGIPHGDLGRLFKLGRHVPNGHPTRRSGQFGIGFKQAAGWLWGRTTVVSRHAGLSGTVKVGWEEWAQSNSWELADPIVQPDATGTGLSIRCEHIDRPAPTIEQIGAITRDGSFLFYPAIRAGARIRCYLRGTRIRWTAFPVPPRTDVVDRELMVGKKRVHLNVGIVPSETSNPRSGLHYYRAHRLVKAMSTLGCGHANPSRIFGTIELSRDWRVSVLKDDIVDPDIDALAAAVEDAIKDILEKAGRMAETLAIKDLETELTARLTGALGKEGGAGDITVSGDSQGPARATTAGSARRRIKPSSDSLRNRVKRGGIRVLFGEHEAALGVGFVEPTPLTIRLNQTHPEVARVLRHKQRHQQLGASFQLAISLLAHFCASTEKGQMTFPFSQGAHGFSVALGEFLTILEND